MTFGNIRNPFLREVGTGHALLPQSPDARRRAEQPELLDPPLHGSLRSPQGLGMARKAKAYTPKEVALIIYYLGEP